MKKVCRVLVVCVLIASLVVFVLHFIEQARTGLGNGLSARYGKELQTSCVRESKQMTKR